MLPKWKHLPLLNGPTCNVVNPAVVGRGYKRAAVKDDEWLYQVADTDAVNQSLSSWKSTVLAALSGTYTTEGSIHCIAQDEEPDIIFEKCVTQRIAECRQNGSSFYSSMVPPVMW